MCVCVCVCACVRACWYVCVFAGNTRETPDKDYNLHVIDPVTQQTVTPA